MFRTILVPTDFSHYAHYAMSYAFALAHKYRATLHLAHVIDNAEIRLADALNALANAEDDHAETIGLPEPPSIVERRTGMLSTTLTLASDVLTGTPTP